MSASPRFAMALMLCASGLGLCQSVRAQDQDNIRACDLAAASPEDSQRPSDIPGVAIDKIVANTDAYSAALTACEVAAAQAPGNLRIATQLARLLGKYDGLEKTEAATRHLDLYKKAAEGGYVLAMVNLSATYLNGDGVAKNPKEGLKWLMQAANPPYDHRKAQFDLAELYRKGTGVTASANTAGPYYCASAESGYVPAMAWCGTANEFGNIGPADPEQAFAWYKKGAYLDDMLAKRQLARAFRYGVGTSIDHFAALQWANKANDAGELEARTVLGDIYLSGDGTARDVGRAMGYYLSAASEGEALAQARLAQQYSDGFNINQNLEQAFYWAKLSADSGDALGQLNLGLLYDEGKGTAINDVKAVELYRKSAEQGSRGAMNNLGEMLIAGEGVEQNVAEGLEWLKKSDAADYDYPSYNMALHYEKPDKGFVYDPRLVAKYLLRALKLNHFRAVDELIANRGAQFQKRTLQQLQTLMVADGKKFVRTSSGLSASALEALRSYIP